MRFLYISTVCTEETFLKIYSNTKLMSGQQIQKFHRLIIKGLTENGIEVATISALPMNQEVSQKRFFKEIKEVKESVTFNYLPIVNFKLLKNLFTIFSSLKRTHKMIRQEPDTAIICDVLNISVTLGAIIAAKLNRKETIGIVTDVPGYMVDNIPENSGLLYKLKSKIISSINLKIIASYDKYIFITEQTNKLLNHQNKPYLILEGLADDKMLQKVNNLCNKYNKKVVMYTGSLAKVYGIKNLVEGFIAANIFNSELHIYGDGDYSNELKERIRNNPSVKYFGVVPNERVVEEQLKATLLVNPRPTIGEYTQYSFPSKNIEYMASGTPVLTTKLSGMPEEYYEYVYLIEDETPNGFEGKLKNILSYSEEELHKKGKDTKRFILENKNAREQGKRIKEKLITNNTN